jgi:hypothetical protein
MEIDYPMYLFSNLVKFYDLEFANMSYDVQYDLLPSMYDEFVYSKFNDHKESLYECIIEYCKVKYPKQ